MPPLDNIEQVLAYPEHNEIRFSSFSEVPQRFRRPPRIIDACDQDCERIPRKDRLGNGPLYTIQGQDQENEVVQIVNVAGPGLGYPAPEVGTGLCPSPGLWRSVMRACWANIFDDRCLIISCS